ncbi:ATP-binding protein [Streptomyces sp. NBC_01724]|uniref:ATP-binding protein n=1 Tax=unclassified Streptomyces TaxID=2593676 RepID=UPI002E356920|nr:ATP-binding protein [Streptomyces sp. NBC_01724]WTE49279.1 ATP-binding protein [Streptomyces sp. NBC_01620]
MCNDLQIPNRPLTPTTRTLYTWTSSTQNPVSSARRAFRGALHEAGVPTEATSDAVLALSELAANATEHATGPYEMTLHRVGTQLICEIHDHDPRIPAAQNAARRTGPDRPDAESDGLPVRGRGLRIVDELTAGAWGFRLPGDGRKSAWMAIPLMAVARRSARSASCP